MRIIATIAAAVLLTGCGGRDVDWDNFDPSVKTRIEGMVDAGDCDGLQDEFDTADANNNDEAADLMAYLDDQMQDLGCY